MIYSSTLVRIADLRDSYNLRVLQEARFHMNKFLFKETFLALQSVSIFANWATKCPY